MASPSSSFNSSSTQSSSPLQIPAAATNFVPICPLCRGDFNLPVKMTCGHEYCYFCIKQFFNVIQECPTCHTPITKDEVECPSVESDRVFDGKWLYQGRDGKWWKYDPVTTSLLEDGYQAFKTPRTPPVIRDQSENVYDGARATFSDEEMSENTSSDSEVSECDKSLVSFFIGKYGYVADFERMVQYRADVPERVRKICRVENSSEHPSPIPDDLIKGIAGIRITAPKKLDA